MNEKRNSMIGIAIGLLAGALVGVGAALLAAPHSGSQTRAMLREKAGEARSRASESLSQVRSKASELTNRLRQQSTESAAVIEYVAE